MAGRTLSQSVQAERRYEARSSERFDRIAYAVSLLKLLRPNVTVAIYPRTRQLQLERGRFPRDWALLGVPPHATRESIACALAELSGLENQRFLIDLLAAQEAPLAG
jgi:hypothetical protein